VPWGTAVANLPGGMAGAGSRSGPIRLGWEGTRWPEVQVLSASEAPEPLPHDPHLGDVSQPFSFLAFPIFPVAGFVGNHMPHPAPGIGRVANVPRINVELELRNGLAAGRRDSQC
jgi:hypothetical protein